jgi:ATP-dependent helicase/nuclease subunit B
VEGRLTPGMRPLDDPLCLADVTVYFPTRRAARAFAAEMIAALGRGATILPSIRTLGDAQEDEEFDPVASGLAALPPAPGAIEQRLLLARLARQWTQAVSRNTREIFGDDDIRIPASPGDALRIAGALEEILAEIHGEEVKWDVLAGLCGGDHAKWWGLTLDFLQVVTRAWPAILAERGQVDPVLRRNAVIDARVSRLARGAMRGPVIAAGSTGSVPATARFLAAILSDPRGVVVLPGLDSGMSEEAWKCLSKPETGDDAAQAATNAQFALARLLRSLGARRSDVETLGEPDAGGEARNRMLSLALLPAGMTGEWAGIASEATAGPLATAGIALVEAPGDREEALAIALAMREVLETPAKTAALITPDRRLARRVAAELRRFAISVDDSAGTALGETPAGRFVLRLAGLCAGEPDPVELAAFVKDPLLCADEDARRIARLFELAVLRGQFTIPRPGGFSPAIVRCKTQVAEKPHHAPAPLARMDEADWEAVARLAAYLDDALAPLHEIAQSRDEMSLAVLVERLADALARLLPVAADAAGSAASPLAGATGGAETLDLLSRLMIAEAQEYELAFGEFGDALAIFMRSQRVRSAGSGHPRLHIFGPLEARLQSADLIVLGGLNEGSWPAAARNDYFLNRPMRGDAGLPVPERRIGQAAHDFSQLAANREVVLARSLRSDNAPTVASRWVQRLLAVCGEGAASGMRARGQRLLQLGRAIDEPAHRTPRAQRPCPTPPVELRPKKLSITEIETWIRDPYAIHARHILALSPLPDLGPQADALLRGTVYHHIAHRFVAEAGDPSDYSLDRLEDIARASFRDFEVPEETASSWLPRFLALGPAFVQWQCRQAERASRILCEAGARIEVENTGFVLSGRADRIDLFGDGGFAVYDYKTGSSPTPKQARSLSPQLALEAAMAQRGAFGVPLGSLVAKLEYVRLRAGGGFDTDGPSDGRDGVSPREAVETAWARLNRLIVEYGNPEQGYRSRYAAMRASSMDGDYDHLARVREWSIGAEEQGDAQA